MQMQMKTQLCSPTIAYLALVLFSEFRMDHTNDQWREMVFRGLCVLVWAAILNSLCIKGYHKTSWVLAFLPLFLLLGGLVLVLGWLGMTELENKLKSA